MCGEHSIRPINLNRSLGSSPHVRGTLDHVGTEFGDFRFIPACAGNIRASACCFAREAVHPRMCGEHISSILTSAACAGSSPHVRGTLKPASAAFGDNRFIPACAGNIAVSGIPCPMLPVHPRMCGEHYEAASQFVAYIGSSPHVRGTSRRRMSEI